MYSIVQLCKREQHALSRTSLAETSYKWREPPL